MVRKKTNKNVLTAAEIKEFKALLLEKLNEILNNVNCMEEDTLRRVRTDLSNLPFHMADAGSDNFEMENTLGLMDSERKLLMEIDDALSRIDNGTYGICESNNEPIPKERLRAIPWARYCVACANSFEKGILVRDDFPNVSDYNSLANNENDNDFDKSANE
jgi:DnaK suppressor protein